MPLRVISLLISSVLDSYVVDKVFDRILFVTVRLLRQFPIYKHIVNERVQTIRVNMLLHAEGFNQYGIAEEELALEEQRRGFGIDLVD